MEILTKASYCMFVPVLRFSNLRAKLSIIHMSHSHSIRPSAVMIPSYDPHKIVVQNTTLNTISNGVFHFL